MKKIMEIIFSAIIVVSCVSKKKFNELAMNKSRLEAAKAECEDSLTMTQAERARLRAQLAGLLNDKNLLFLFCLYSSEYLLNLLSLCIYPGL